MAQFRVGCVPYVNARPLIAAFDQPNDYVEVVYEVPSGLPALLDSGAVDAILVSSIELLRRRDLLPIGTVGIMSTGCVQSVRMLSKVPLESIETLALDLSSMTSNMLAQVLLAEKGVFPKVEPLAPNSAEMLANHDACVIIGDRGFEANGTGLIDVDLGQAWTEMTGLPFVWALWLGRQDIPLNWMLFGNLLDSAYRASGFAELHQAVIQGKEPLALDGASSRRRRSVVESAVARSGWTYEQAEQYLTFGVCHEHPKWLDAIQEFTRLIRKHGLADVEMPLALRTDDIQRETEALLEHSGLSQ